MQERYGSYVLKSQGSIKYDSSVEGKFTVNQLKMALDPLGDLSLISHMGHELDEFIDMYYRPCIAALFGTNVGSSPDVEAKYFMAYGWLTHEACSKLSCLAENMRWNRNGSGCIESLITGRNAPVYDPNDIACEKDDEINPSAGSEPCKYKTNDLQLYQERINYCWNDPNPASRIPYYMMENFCMPEIIGEKIDEEILHPCSRLNSINVALSSNGGVALQSSTYDGDGYPTGNPSVVPSIQPSYMPSILPSVVSLVWSTAPTDRDTFNTKFVANGGLVERTCPGCGSDHQTMVYKRTSALPAGKDWYQLFMEDWFSSQNNINTDFKLYSSVSDAETDTNAWQYCNYDDPGIGFPRDCGKTGGVGGQWNSLTRGGKSASWEMPQ